MIDRYSQPEMQAIWSEKNKFSIMLEVEVLACEAMAELGEIPKEAAKTIREKADFDVDRIKEIERVTKHDLIAFVSSVAEYVGEDAKYIHLGMTSSDVLDTSFSVQLRQAGLLILDRVDRLIEVLKKQAVRYKDTLAMGRTHGVHAEPVTFGLKLAMWYTEMCRQRERLVRAIDNVSVGAISGAVGTFANIDPQIEAYVCEHLSLRPETVSTQIIQRDHHLEYMMALANIATSLEKFATEIRNLQRTEIAELQESFAKGQKGSSAMPHKRNPIHCERVCGLARVIRGNVTPAAENCVTWHERDISHSSVERIIMPDSTALLYYILGIFTNVAENLVVNEDQMQANVAKTLGLIFSQRVLLALVESGVARDTAYPWVQENAMRAWDEKIPFHDLVRQDKRITEHLDATTIDNIFDYSYHTKRVDFIFRRAGLID